MLKFYYVNPIYAEFLRNSDNRVPNITYASHNKFVCGVVLHISSYNYFAPISSKTDKQRTNLIIQNEGQALSSIKFSYMFPVPSSELSELDINGTIRSQDPRYADLLDKEYEFCRNNESNIINNATKVYGKAINPLDYFHNICCDFKLLEQKHDEWVNSHSIK